MFFSFVFNIVSLACNEYVRLRYSESLLSHFLKQSVEQPANCGISLGKEIFLGKEIYRSCCNTAADTTVFRVIYKLIEQSLVRKLDASLTKRRLFHACFSHRCFPELYASQLLSAGSAIRDGRVNTTPTLHRNFHCSEIAAY